MMLSSFPALALRLQLAARRLGWGNALALLLGVPATTLTLVWLPHVRQDLRREQSVLERARQDWNHPGKEDMKPARTTDELRLEAFYRSLGEYRYAEQQIKTLFAIAVKTSVSLDQGEYRRAYDKNGRFHTYQVTLPVKGSYANIRQFCEQVLLAVPFASLDQINVKREAIANNTIEAHLRFTLYLDVEETAGDNLQNRESGE